MQRLFETILTFSKIAGLLKSKSGERMKGKKIGARERAVKLREDANYRRIIFKELIEHLLRCRSIDCFYAISEETIYEFCNKYPSEFKLDEIIEAKRQAKEAWEKIGHDQSTGLCLGNSRSWYYNMSNRYGWSDKVDVKAKTEGSVSVNIVNYSSKKTPNTDEKAN